MNKVQESTERRGRKKGVPNKTTRSVKEAIEYAAQGLGGADRLIAWAREDKTNERVFWGNIYPKILPLQVHGDPANPLYVEARINVSNLTHDQLRAIGSIPING